VSSGKLPTNTSGLGTVNRGRVLNVIARSGPISRAEIARSTGLTPTASGSIVDDLIGEGFVRKSSASLTGPAARRSILVELNGNRAHVIGLHMGVAALTAVRLDLAGHVVGRYREAITQTDETALLAYMDHAFQALALKPDGVEILGVGVGMHGTVDFERGISRFAPHFGLHNWPLRQLLGQRFQMPVLVENGVRTMAWGEHQFGSARGQANCAGLNLGTGIGAGIILGGQLYRGELGVAGEIGHVIVDANGPRCVCGNYGCLEAIASGPAIVRRAAALIKQGQRSSLSTLVPDLENLTAETLGTAARQGDGLASQVLSEAAVLTGIAIANLANTLGLSFIVVGGSVTRAGEPYLTVVRNTARAKVLSYLAETVTVVPGIVENAGAMGAAALVLERFFAGAYYNPLGEAVGRPATGSAVGQAAT
jgi:predicted NBD/HSP70 family sugar kinase